MPQNCKHVSFCLWCLAKWRSKNRVGNTQKKVLPRAQLSKLKSNTVYFWCGNFRAVPRLVQSTTTRMLSFSHPLNHTQTPILLPLLSHHIASFSFHFNAFNAGSDNEGDNLELLWQLAWEGMEGRQDARRACPPESPTFGGVTAKTT